MVIGLTGGIASGKSTVSRMFEEAEVPIICLDALAREVVKPGAPALEEIRKEFGDAVLDSDGGLDRTAMARVVFENPDKRKKLEAIIHPRVEQEKDRISSELERSGHDLLVLDVPLLYEVGWDRSCDVVVVVYVPRIVQEQRLRQRDGLTEKDARLRLQAQIPIDEKRERADFVIDNSGDLKETRAQFEAVLAQLRVMAARSKKRETGW
ncbi:MAG: dephospho-CoA kinase [Deltaproteobacteria bacterium]|nr:dephospho-CoA kinase [Deltaproteobacteria bacterium]